MTEQDQMDAFETRLTALARSYTEPAVRSIDAIATARAAMASSTRGRVFGSLWPIGLDRRVVWMLLLAALVVALAGDRRRSRFPSVARRPGTRRPRTARFRARWRPLRRRG